jgi:hypothetical protein
MVAWLASCGRGRSARTVRLAALCLQGLVIWCAAATPPRRPIHQRLGDLIRARNTRLSALRMIVEREREERGENFAPKINPRSEEIVSRARARSTSPQRIWERNGSPPLGALPQSRAWSRGVSRSPRHAEAAAGGGDDTRQGSAPRDQRGRSASPAGALRRRSARFSSRPLCMDASMVSCQPTVSASSTPDAVEVTPLLVTTRGRVHNPPPRPCPRQARRAGGGGSCRRWLHLLPCNQRRKRSHAGCQ